MSRLDREKHTLLVMIGMYCRKHHVKVLPGLCADCAGLLNYAFTRIDKCPYKADKPPCIKCPVHCYQPEMCEKVRAVMRYSGPRMLQYHPVLTALHYLDKIKNRMTSG